MPKPVVGEAYNRAGLSGGDPGGIGRWRGPSINDVPYMTTPDAPLQPIAMPVRPLSPPRLLPQPGPSESKHELFELFTTTEFKILRATPASFSLTGYHPHEYVNINLLDWIHPGDRHHLDLERNRLINVPFVAAPLQSNRETQAALTHLSERELLSPAEGMREPYPNQNVRVLRSDHSFDWFNVRLHLGGGLGASLWSDTLGKVYLVVSLLLLRAPPDYVTDDASRRPVQMVPPTPVTPAAPMTSQQALPSFSSFAAAAAAEAPRSRQEPPSPAQQTQYYPNRPPPPPAAQYNYPRPNPTPPTYPSRRSQSPNHRPTPSPAAYPEYPPQPQQAYYPDRHADSVQYRKTGGEEDDRARGRPAVLPPPGDYSRRAWEL